MAQCVMNERRLRALFCDVMALLSAGGMSAGGLGCASSPPASGSAEGAQPQSAQPEPGESSPVVEVSPLGSGGVTELPPPPPRKPASPPSLALDACKGGYPQVLSGIRPASRIDYAELRLVHGMGDRARVRVTSRIGLLCATADSDVACRKSLGESRGRDRNEHDDSADRERIAHDFSS